MHHTRKKEIRSFIEYLLQLQVSVKKYLFDKLSSRTLPRSIEIIAPQPCVPSVTWNWQWGNSRDPRREFPGCLPQGKISCTCGRWIHHREWRHVFLRSRAVHLHLLHHMQSTTLVQQEKLSFAHLLSQWIALRFHIHHEAHRDDDWGTMRSFPPPKTRRCRLSATAFNSRTRWNSSAVLSDPSWFRHLERTSICTCTPNNNYASTASLEASNRMTNTSICWHGKNPCSTVSSNHTTHWTIPSFLLANNASMIWRERWCHKTNMITW